MGYPYGPMALKEPLNPTSEPIFDLLTLSVLRVCWCLFRRTLASQSSFICTILPGVCSRRHVRGLLNEEVGCPVIEVLGVEIERVDAVQPATSPAR